ncbi:MAG: hypothetical protein O3A84_13645 [Proteobacteria bacterium]|nr:hypothetical protein [Pseudomonadota bacterium]
MTRQYLWVAGLLLLTSCASPPDLTANSCDQLERELDIAIADMSKPAHDRHYARRPTGFAGMTIGAVAVNAANTLGVNRPYDERIDAPEVYAKRIGRQIATRCNT